MKNQNIAFRCCYMPQNHFSKISFK
jgi:hypothetical protein